MTFFDEGFVDARTDEALVEGWPSLTFTAAGVVTTVDGETERFTFTAERDGDGYRLKVRGADGKVTTRHWRWLDAERASTDLWGGPERIASRRKPSPAERRDAFGEKLASRELSAGAFRTKKGLLVEVGADGGVRWGAEGRGTFFSCRLECSPDAETFLCLRHESAPTEYVFKSEDAGVMAAPVRQYDPCGAREVVEGEGLSQKPLSTPRLNRRTKLR